MRGSILLSPVTLYSAHTTCGLQELPLWDPSHSNPCLNADVTPITQVFTHGWNQCLAQGPKSHWPCHSTKWVLGAAALRDPEATCSQGFQDYEKLPW